LKPSGLFDWHLWPQVVSHKQVIPGTITLFKRRCLLVFLLVRIGIFWRQGLHPGLNPALQMRCAKKGVFSEMELRCWQPVGWTTHRDRNECFEAIAGLGPEDSNSYNFRGIGALERVTAYGLESRLA
jgi:hypothetical protein